MVKNCIHKIVKAENDGYVCCRCGKSAEKNIELKEDFLGANLGLILGGAIILIVYLVLMGWLLTILNPVPDPTIATIIILMMIAFPITIAWIGYIAGSEKYKKVIYFTIDKKRVEEEIIW